MFCVGEMKQNGFCWDLTKASSQFESIDPANFDSIPMQAECGGEEPRN